MKVTLTGRARRSRVGDDRRDGAENQPDQRADEQRGAARVRRRLHRARRHDDLRALDLLGEPELLLQRLLLRDQVAEPRLRVVLLADDHELLERIEVPGRLLRRGDHREALVDRGDLRGHVVERRLEGADLQTDVGRRRPADDDRCERVRRGRRGRRPRAGDRQRDQRRRARGARAGGRADLRDRDMPAQRRRPHVGAIRRLRLRVGGADDQRDRARVRAEAVDEHAAGRGRLPERDQRRRLVVRPAAKGVEDADDRADDEPGDGQPPQRDDRTAPAGEVDLALFVACGAHRLVTLSEAHCHCCARPSSQRTCRRPAELAFDPVVSAFVRCCRRGCGGPSVTSQRAARDRLEQRQSSRIVASLAAADVVDARRRAPARDRRVDDVRDVGPTSATASRRRTARTPRPRRARRRSRANAMSGRCRGP